MTSGIEQSVHVVTTVSMLSFSNGMVSADASRNSIDRETASPLRRAIESNFGEGSSPMTCLTVFP